MKSTETRENLEFFAEYFAYAMFANMHTNHLYKQLDINEISGFLVYLFFNEFEAEEPGEEPFVEMNCRITIKGKPDERGKTKDTQVMYTQEKYFAAIIDQVYESTGVFQHYEFEFGVPNQLKLYDAEFLIEEKLGIDLDDEE